jgi:hypothetical protein
MSEWMNYQGRWLGLYVCKHNGGQPHVWQVLFRIERRRKLNVEYR